MANSKQSSSGIVAAEPEPISLNWSATALVIIDMQRDFMEPGGFGETLGNDVWRPRVLESRADSIVWFST